MGRILAIDYGQKRVGIAVSDPMQIIATGLDTVNVNDIFPYIEKYVQLNKVEKFVVGFAKQMDGKDSESMKYIRPFVQSLKNKYPSIEVVYVDERFTSSLAQKTILDAGLKKKDRQNKALVDKVSATIILQSYLESNRKTL